MDPVAGQGLEQAEGDEEGGAVLEDHQGDEDDDVVPERVVGLVTERRLQQHLPEVLEAGEVGRLQAVELVEGVAKGR